MVGVKLMRVRWWFDPVIIPPNNTNNTILENSDLSLSFKLLQLIILFVHMIMNNNYKKKRQCFFGCNRLFSFMDCFVN